MTTRPWRLTRQAETSLLDIARWTARRFGPRQASAYEVDLIERCEAIAAGTAPSRSCRDAVDPTLDPRLRLTRCGGHFVIFVELPEMVVVVDFLHAKADLPRRLGRSEGDGDGA